MKRHHKSQDGFYHIKGRKFEELEGSRAKVWHGTAYKTSGGLTKDKLLMNKHGRVVSRKKHATAKKDKRLEKAGYKPVKGRFTPMRKNKRVSPKNTGKRRRKATRKRRR